MPDAQEIADKIRDVLGAQDQSLTSGMRDMAAAYADLCRNANERIRRASLLLKQGLKTEAVELAEAAPNVLDQLAILDFSERSDWKQFCLQYGLPEAPALEVEAAGALNQAYAALQPVGVLLAKHRRLALARAPLSLRLVVMRELARLDKAAFWADDIRAFEAARLEEIRRLVAAPAQNRVALALRSEINSRQWSIPVPAELLREVKARAEKIEQEDLRVGLARLLPELDAAYSAMDETRSREILAKCQELIGTHRCAEDAEERLRAVGSWLDSLEKGRTEHLNFLRAGAALEQAIDTSRPSEVIRRAYQATTRFAEPLPTELEKRYHACLARREREAARRRRLIYFGGAAATVVLLVAIGLFTFYRIRGGEVRGWARVLKAAEVRVTQRGDSRDGSSVLSTLAKAPAALRDAPTVANAAAALWASLAAEKLRAARFKRLYAQARKLAIGDHRALAAMRAARAIALRPGERAAITVWFKRHKLYAQTRQSQRDGAFESAAAKLVGAIDETLSDAALSSGPAAAAREIAVFQARAAKLAVATGITARLYNTETTSVEALLRGRQAKLDDLQRDQVDYQRILSPPVDLDAYVTALRAYLDHHPSGRFVGQVQQLAKLAAAARAVSAWSDLARTWPGNPEDPQRSLVATRVAQIQQYCKQFPQSPLLSAARAYESYLIAGATATAPDGPWRGRFHRVLQNRLLRRLNVLTLSDGKTYFVLPGTTAKAVSSMNGQITYAFPAVVSADMSTAQEELASGVCVKSVVPSPAMRFASMAARAIRGMRFDQSNTIGLQMMAELARSPVNPVVKGLLLSDLITLDEPALPPQEARRFARAVKRLSKLNLENINWLDPSQSVPASVAYRVAQVAKGLPALVEPIVTHLMQTNMAIADGASFKVSCLGVVKTVAGKPVVVCGPLALPDGSSAWMLSSRENGYGLSRIATFSMGQWRWIGASKAPFIDGSLVFICGAGG